MSAPIIIVGGGPVGSTLALALAKQGVQSTILEARSRGAAYQDQRALALSHGSRVILEKLGVWAHVGADATEIRTIHISQRGSFGRTLLKAEEHDLPALGYVVAYGALQRALDEALGAEVDVIEEAEAKEIVPGADAAQVIYLRKGKQHTLSGGLLVQADGGHGVGKIAGITRQTKEYGHDALVSKVTCELPHHHIAYERFTPQGPMALLPNGKDFSLVWTGKCDEIQALLALDDATFLTKLHAHFGDRVGRFLHVEKRLTFPLKLASLSSVIAPHVAVIGNAAQTMHPVAGQGFNVGLRDAYELAMLIAKTPQTDWGGALMLETYAGGRKQDTKRGLLFTDFLVSTFSNEVLGLNPLRGFGLAALQLLPSVKRHLVDKMSYGA